MGQLTMLIIMLRLMTHMQCFSWLAKSHNKITKTGGAHGETAVRDEDRP